MVRLEVRLSGGSTRRREAKTGVEDSFSGHESRKGREDDGCEPERHTQSLKDVSVEWELPTFFIGQGEDWRGKEGGKERE